MEPRSGETWELTTDNGDTLRYHISAVTADRVYIKAGGEDYSVPADLWRHLSGNGFQRVH